MNAPEPTQRRHRPVVYDAIRPHVESGWIALARAVSLEGLAVAVETGSPYVHATMLGWLSACEGGPEDRTADVLLIGETIRRHGGRLVSFGDEVRADPGCYDLFRPRTQFYCGARAWAWMARAAGSPYGLRHLSRVWLRRHLGRWIPPIANSDDPRWPRNCSALVHAALRTGCGPQVKTWDCDVVPGDLAEDRWFEYMGTVFYSAEQAEACANNERIVK